MSARFVVIGVPAPQGSKRAFVRNGRAILTESAGASHRAWRNAVAETLHAGWFNQPALDGPLQVTIVFSMPRPKTAARRMWHDRRPDLDKLVRSTLDGVTDAGVIADDARISRLTAVKSYALHDSPWVGAEITIDELEPAA